MSPLSAKSVSRLKASPTIGLKALPTWQRCPQTLRHHQIADDFGDRCRQGHRHRLLGLSLTRSFDGGGASTHQGQKREKRHLQGC